MAFITWVLVTDPSSAAPYPHEGLATQWTQPGGAVLSLRVYGDEFYARTTTLDGYAVVFESADNTYYYATPAADGENLVSSGVPAHWLPPKTLKRNLKDSDKHVREQRKINLQRFAPDRSARWRARVKAVRELRGPAALLQAAPAASPEAVLAGAPIGGSKQGLVILVQFPDDPATPGIADAVSFPATREKMERFCNEVGYADDGSTGSIRDYFYDQSNGLLTHTQNVTAIVTLPHPRNYYNYADYPANTTLEPNCGITGRKLIDDAVAKLKSDGFDFSSLAVDSGNYILATSLLFAGNDSGVWPKGLWPHAWSMATPIDVGSPGSPRYVFRYQMTNVSDAMPVIGTVCHELGHLLLDYPDFYDYGYESAGLGFHSLMGAGNHLNGGKTPAPIDLYLKSVSGWANIIDVESSDSFDAVLTSTGNHGYRMRKPGTETEYFLLENRGAGDKWASYSPDKGIAIWHVDESFSGTEYEQMTPTQHYEISLEQADGRFDLERNWNGGDSGDLFDVADSFFNNTTDPNADWWDGSPSGFSATVLSEASDAMIVRFGAGAPSATLAVSPPLWEVPSSGGSFSFTVTSDTTWTWGLDTGWISSLEASPQSGVQTFTYQVAPNTLAGSRIAEIVFVGGGLTRVHVVRQEGAEVDDHGDSISTATLIGQNSETPGNIETPGDDDYFRIDADASGVLLVESSGSADTFGTLRDSTGAEIQSDDDSGDELNFRISRVVTPGTYYLQVRHYDIDRTGAYDVRCALSPSMELSVTPPSFTVPAEGSALTFDVVSNVPWTWSSDSAWVVSREAVSQTGDQAFTYTIGANPGAGGRVAVIALTGGGFTRTHTVIQEGALSDDHGNTVATATVIGLNSLTNGVIDVPGDLDYFRIEVPEIGRLELESTGTQDLFGTLYDTAGNLLLLDDDSGAETNFRMGIAVTPGTYYLAIRHFSPASTGAYQLACVFIPGSVLTPQPSAISVSGFGDRLAFDVACNASWSWSKDADWILTSEASNQTGNQRFEFTVTSNTGSEVRSGTITLLSGALAATVTITQTGTVPGEFANTLIQTLPDGSQSVWQTQGDNKLVEARLDTTDGSFGDAFDGVGRTRIEYRPDPLGNVTATNLWTNHPIEQQAGTFKASFSTIPSGTSVDTVIGFSNGAADHWRDLAAYVRFNPSGTVDARNGAGFNAAQILNYNAGVSYLVEMEIDVVAKRYRAVVTPAGGTPTLIADDFAFRTDQEEVSQLTNFCCLTWTGGTQQVGGFIGPATASGTSTNIWSNRPIASQTGTFVSSFTTIPGGSAVDTVVGFSNGTADFWTDLAAYVRFNPGGIIDARNGGGFSAVNLLNYAAGVSYRVEMEINVGTRRYNATVTPAGGVPVVIANDFAFRLEQNTVIQLNNFAFLTWTGGNQTVGGAARPGRIFDFGPLASPGPQGPLVSSSTSGDLAIRKEVRLVPGCHATDEIIKVENLSGVPGIATLRLEDNYGSDGSTSVHMTSSGDPVVGSGDDWFVSSDGLDPDLPGSDPALMVSWRASGVFGMPALAQVPGAGADTMKWLVIERTAGGQFGQLIVRRELFDSAARAVAGGSPIGNSNANLANLTTSTGGVSPTFHPETTDYQLNVVHGVTSISVTPTLEDSNGAVRVNGLTVASGAPSGPIMLQPGQNTITVIATAEDKVTTMIYRLVVFRAGGPEIVLEDRGGGGMSDGGTVTFGHVAVGDEAGLKLTIRNTGVAMLEDLSIAKDGTHEADFTVDFNPGTSMIAPGGEVSFNVRFRSSAIGVRTAAIHIASNDLDENSFDIVLVADSATARDVYFAAAADAGLLGMDAETRASPFADGIGNLLKYAFNMNLAGPDSHAMVRGTGGSGLPRVTIEGTGASALIRVEFVRRRGSGLIYRPLVSGSLLPGSFRLMDQGSLTETEIDDTWRRVVVTEFVNLATTPRLFASVQVSIP